MVAPAAGLSASCSSRRYEPSVTPVHCIPVHESARLDGTSNSAVRACPEAELGLGGEDGIDVVSALLMSE